MSLATSPTVPDGKSGESQFDSQSNVAQQTMETPSIGGVTSKPCIHCGLPTMVAADSDPAEPVFCCSGCHGAYGLIQGWGLDEYYALRDQLTVTGAALAASDQKNYQQFDTPEFLGESSPKTTADGLECVELGVHGIHCAACTWLIERALLHQVGMQAARVKLSDHTLKLIYDPKQTKLSGIARFLDRLGYQLLPLDRSRENHLRQENRRMLIQIAIAGFFAANAMWIAVALYAGQFSGLAAEHKYLFELVGMGLGSAAVFGPGRTFLRGAIASIKTRTPHMDLPIGLALFVGAVIGTWNAIRGAGDVYFDGLSSLVFLLLIGRWIQFRQQHQAAQSVELMMRVTPRHANLIAEDGTETSVMVDRLNQGDHIRVGAGECVPADGVIIEGISRLNRSLLTGESLPVAVNPGDCIEAGTVNVGSPLVLKVSATGKNSRIGQIMQSVEAAATEKTPIVQLADRIGGIFVVVVVFLAFLTFAIWLPQSLQQATSFATAMLIVACPCALAMATPLAIAVGIGRAAKAQILVRDGSALQHLSKPGMLWIDKTGTLTEGSQHAQLVWGTPHALMLAAAVESQCQHPIAQAIVKASEIHSSYMAAIKESYRPSAVDVSVVPGGVIGIVDGCVVQVGNAALLATKGIRIPDSALELASTLARNGSTPIYVAVNQEAVALLGLSDPIRPQAAALVQSAKQLGWTVGMLSGDLSEIATRVGSEVGIARDMCRGGVSPEDKLATVKQSRDQFPTVVMIGDGANDAAALAASDVGIAVRGGAEVSLHAAPVYLANSQLTNIARLLKGSVTTTRVIYFNFAVSLAYNLVAVGLAITGNISPLLAAIIMPLSSVTVLGLTFAIPSFSSRSTEKVA